MSPTQRSVKKSIASDRSKALSPRGRGSGIASENPDRLLQIFADNVRLVRTSQKMSQDELADLSDLDRTYISGIERKQRNLGIRNIQRIAEALQIDPKELLDPALSNDPRFIG